MHGVETVSALDRGVTAPRANQVFAAMRLMLALLALCILTFDRNEPVLFPPIAYTVLTVYVILSALILFGRLLRPVQAAALAENAHWIDVGCYAALGVANLGNYHLSVFGFILAILIASFRKGFTTGVWVSLASGLAMLADRIARALSGGLVDPDDMALSPLYLLVVGFMIAYLGGYELDLKRRLALLREVSTLSNPRFGVERTLSSLMKRLCAFYRANSCLLVTLGPSEGEYILWRIDASDPVEARRPVAIPANIGRQLLEVETQGPIIYAARPLHQRYRLAPGVARDSYRSEIASALGAVSFLAVPFRFGAQQSGRLYLVADNRVFSEADGDLLLQVVAQVSPVLDNIRLIDQLASSAGEEERRRIARDLHDSVIQPYIGIQLGIQALQQHWHNDQRGVDQAIDRLVVLGQEGLQSLRSYVSDLDGPRAVRGGLDQALRRFAARFANATGLCVDLHIDQSIMLNDRLAAEVFQLVSEGLSNVQRHTDAERASVELRRADATLRISIANRNAGQQAPPPFVPRSISGRAAALGGLTHIHVNAGGNTVVEIAIPL